VPAESTVWRRSIVSGWGSTSSSASCRRGVGRGGARCRGGRGGEDAQCVLVEPFGVGVDVDGALKGVERVFRPVVPLGQGGEPVQHVKDAAAQVVLIGETDQPVVRVRSPPCGAHIDDGQPLPVAV
jgi:hypothetical protein